MSNINLKNAIKNKNDEFYTFYEDIENEMQYYNFEGKTVYCNCDNPYHSNFVRYFMDNFDRLKLKRVISTCKHTKGMKFQYDNTNRGIVFDSDVYNYINIKHGLSYPQALEGNGDFRSEECLKYLQEADIVVTNPPFSLWREFVLLMEKYNKKYIILGNINIITTKDIFPLIYHKRMLEGVTVKSSITFLDKKNNCKKFANIRWFTNIEHGQPNTGVKLVEEYTPEKYPKYDNTDIINVDRVKDIPKDYYGIMGVPITYLDKHNDEQFEIVGYAGNNTIDNYQPCKNCINGKWKYKRILIKRKGG